MSHRPINSLLISLASSDLHIFEQVVCHRQFGFDFASFHVRTWTLVKQYFGCNNAFDPDNFFIVSFAVNSLGVQPRFF